jgi:hypothetical protein
MCSGTLEVGTQWRDDDATGEVGVKAVEKDERVDASK